MERTRKKTYRVSFKFRITGFIVKDVWGAGIHRARRGPRNQQQSVYLDLSLKRNEPARLNLSIPVLLLQALANLSVPDEWKIIRDKPDC